MAMTAALTAAQRDLVALGPIGSLDEYIRAVKSIPVLDEDTERALARRYHEHEDLDAARQLVLSQLRFVVHIARGYMGYGLPLGDLIQEGNIGLMKAVKRFDPGHGVRLVSFAVHWIRAEIHEYVLRNWRLVKVATTKAQRKLFFNLRRARQHLGWLTHEEREAIADDLGVSASDVGEMEQRLGGADISFDPITQSDGETEPSPSLYLASDDGDPATAIEADDWQSNATDRLHEALETLDARSREILQARWLGESRETLHTLAERYGISAERVRQLEQQAIRRIRERIAA